MKWKTICGGSWYNLPRYARVADHFRNTPDFRISDLGLRLVRRKR